MRKAFTRIFIVQLILVSFAVQGMAVGNIRFGNLEIHPYASAEQQSNDNIYTEGKKLEDGDQITIYRTGLMLNRPLVPGRDFILKADYFADFYQYRKNDKEDRTDHTVKASADFTFANNLIFKAKEDFKKTSDPPNSELTLLEKRIRNSSEGILGVKNEKIGIECGYNYIGDNYNTLQSLDKKEHIIRPTLYLNISPKTAVFVEYVFSQVRYDHSTTNIDSDYKQRRVGIRGQIAPKLTGTVKAGYKTTDYDDPRTINERNFQGSTFFGKLNYKMNKRCSINAYGNRSSNESTYSTNNYYISSSGGGTVEHELLWGFSVIGGGSYEKNKYPEDVTESGVIAKRIDHIRGATGGLKWIIKEWLVAEGSYNYKERESIFANYDYKNSIYSGKLSVKF